MSAIIEFADKLRSQIDIADLVGRYVQLRRTGSNMKGHCPFHNEKTPSFTVSTTKQIFHCFGCQEGGDAIKFIQKIERLEWIEAVRHLSKEYNIPMPEMARSRTNDAARQARQNDREAALSAVSYATDFFNKHLMQQIQAGAEIRDYLNRRRLGPDAIKQFNLGLAPDAWTGLLDAARTAGHHPSSLLNSGLAIRHAEKERIYDRFRNRLIFPIHDTHGTPIAFGARVYAQDAGPHEPKYINSPETLAYHKGQALYALHLAKDPIVKADQAILMEGYMDVIAAHLAGITNSIATCGTALTDEQARLLKRFSHNVVFLYDGDEAGQKAMLRGTETLLAQGLNVSIVNLPQGHDPDSYLREHGPDSLRQQIATATSFFNYFLTVAVQRYDVTTAEGKVQAVELLLPLLRRVKHTIAKNDYARRLADRLQVDPILVQRQISTDNPNSIDRIRQSIINTHDTGESLVETTLLKLMVECPAARNRIREKINPQWLRNHFVKKWYQECCAAIPEELCWEYLLSSDAINNDDEAAQLRALAVTDLTCDSSEATIDHVATRIQRHYLRERTKALVEEIDAFFRATPEDEELMNKLRSADENTTPVRPLLNRYFIKPDLRRDRH